MSGFTITIHRLVLGVVLLAATAAGGTSSISPRDEAAGMDKIAPRLQQALALAHEAQVVWVFFADKGLASPRAHREAIVNLEQTYNKRAIQRRALRGDNAARGGALFDARDLPVAPAYVDGVVGTGVKLRSVSTWLNAVSVVARAEQIRAIAAMGCVERIQLVARRTRDRIDEGKPIDGINTGAAGDRSIDYGLSLDHLQQIDLVALHDEGYTGAGVIVGVLDTGFRLTHEAFNEPGHALDVIAQWDFVNDDPNPGEEPGDDPAQHSHGTRILGLLGAYKPGTLVGGAYDASFVLAKTEDITDEYEAEEDYYVAGLQFIEANGGDLFTASLSYDDWYDPSDFDGETAVTTLAVNIAADNGVHGCNSAGNSSHDADPGTWSIGAPADGFKVISCGAVDENDVIASYSSDGPTADGRVKPELLARGTGASAATVDPDLDDAYVTTGGTSAAAPIVACAVACLVQKHPDWTVDEMRNALIKTGQDYVVTGTHDPLYVRGYGLADAYEAGRDCNYNAIPDWVDITEFGLPDTNLDGIPDECEWDCNDNGVADFIDIDPADPDGDGEVSADCQDDGIPDECQLGAPCTNQSPNHLNSYASDLRVNYVQAERFVLTETHQLAGVRFWGRYPPDNQTSDPDAFTIVIRPDDSGEPGSASLLTIGPVPATTRTATGVILFGISDEYAFEIDFGLHLELVAGIYWVQIYNDTALAPNYWSWETGSPDPVGGDGMHKVSLQMPPNEQWQTTTHDMSLVLICHDNDLNDNDIPDECDDEIPGDTNGDGAVNTDDFLAVLSNWGDCPEPCPPYCDPDVTNDCHVNTDDFLAVLSNWTP